MTSRHIVTIEIEMTESLEEAKRQGVIGQLEDDVHFMLEDFKKLNGEDDAYGAPVVTKCDFKIEST
jgi:hypothetical protein